MNEIIDVGEYDRARHRTVEAYDEQASQAIHDAMESWLFFQRALEIRTMDGISAWFHETLDKMRAYIDPSISMTLLRFLVEEQDRLGTGSERITRVMAIIQGLMELGPMNQETLGSSPSALAHLSQAQRLVE